MWYKRREFEHASDNTIRKMVVAITPDMPERGGSLLLSVMAAHDSGNCMPTSARLFYGLVKTFKVWSSVLHKLSGNCSRCVSRTKVSPC